MRTAILEFNQTSEDYFISVQNYGPATTLAELDAAFSRINTEILAGRSPEAPAPPPERPHGSGTARRRSGSR